MLRHRRRRKHAATGTGAVRGVFPRGKVRSALTVLMEDHERIEALFRQFEMLSCVAPVPPIALIPEICDALEVHSTLEEQLFYPALVRALRGRRAALESELEHRHFARLIAEVRMLEPEAPRTLAAFRVLMRHTRRHMRKEERQVFRLARTLPLDLEEIGARMQTLHKTLLGRQDIARTPAISGPDAEAAERHSRGEVHYRDVARH